MNMEVSALPANALAPATSAGRPAAAGKFGGGGERLAGLGMVTVKDEWSETSAGCEDRTRGVCQQRPGNVAGFCSVQP